MGGRRESREAFGRCNVGMEMEREVSFPGGFMAAFLSGERGVVEVLGLEL